MPGDHERGSKKGKFCGVAGTPCDCGNDYVKNSDLGAWSGAAFQRLVRAASGHFSFAKQFEAHHILCVAPVSSEIVSSPGLDGVIRETTWCINAKSNMYAMPLWGHTVKHYCTIIASGGSILAVAVPPPFANIPQHDYDHNCAGGYTHEVEQKLKSIEKQIQEAGHSITPQNIAGTLNAHSNSFKGLLQARGARNGGTHAGWNLGMQSPTSRWYVPFSMASDGCLTEKGYPVRKFDARVAQWIDRIAKALAT